MLEVPTAVLKFHREPVEEFRVGWLFPLEAEVFGGAHEAVAEDALPGAVDKDA